MSKPKVFKTGSVELEGGSIWGGHNFISLRHQKGIIWQGIGSYTRYYGGGHIGFPIPIKKTLNIVSDHQMTICNSWIVWVQSW